MEWLRSWLVTGAFFPLGIFFHLEDGKALNLKLSKNELASEPMVAIIRDWDGFQFWGNEAKICVPYLTIRGKDSLGLWVNSPELHRPQSIELSVIDLSCSDWEDDLTDLEIFHFEDEVKSSIAHQKEFIPEIIWRPSVQKDNQSKWQSEETFQVHLRTSNFAVLSPKTSLPVLVAENWSPIFRMDSSTGEIRDALLKVLSNLKKEDRHWVLRMKSPPKNKNAFQRSVRTLLKNTVTMGDPSLVYETDALRVGEFQIVVSKGDLPEKGPIVQEVFKPKPLNPSEISANTREKWQQIENLRFKKRPAWFSSIPTFVNGKKMEWIEDQLLLIPLKRSQTVLDLELKGDDSQIQFKAQIFISGSEPVKQSQYLVSPINFKRGPNTWKYHKITFN